MSPAVTAARSRASSKPTICHIGKRCLHNTAPRRSSPFFALARLSNSRETQHLSKLSKLSRIEHSPPLQLIQSSEVLPFAPPAPPKIPQSVQITERPVLAAASTDKVAAKNDVPEKPIRNEETDLMSVGRAILAEKNAAIVRLQKALDEEKDRSAKRETSYSLARTKARERIHRLDSDLMSAKVWKWFLLVVGVSYATWAYALDPDTKKYSSTSRNWNASPINDAAVSPVVLSKPQPAVVSLPVQTERTPSSVPKLEPALPSVVNGSSVKASSWPNIFWAK